MTKEQADALCELVKALANLPEHRIDAEIRARFLALKEAFNGEEKG